MTRYAFLIFSFALAVGAMSARTVTGTVFSDSDSTAVVGASCRLNSDGRFLKGTSTDAKGVFTISTDDKHRLKLEVSMTGFTSTEIIIESGSKDIDLGIVYLNEGVNLGEVTVTADSQMEVKGRTIVYPSTDEIRASATSISLFKKLPLAGLEANPINRTISVDGGTPMIVINGVPSTMDEVNSLQPKDITKIEYSRITPARYADKGNSGFISITLKKRDDGGRIFAWGRSAVTTAFVDGNINGSYHQGPSQFSLSYNPSWRNYHKVIENVDESYIGDDFRVNLERHTRAPMNYFMNTVRFKYDYSPDERTLFSANFRAVPMDDKSISESKTVDSELGKYDNYNLSKGHDFSPSLDLFFRRDFNKKNSLEVQVVGTLSANDYRRDNRYVFADGKEDNYLMNVDSRRRSLISEVSYTHTFSERTSFSTGYQNTISHSRNKYLSSDYEPVLTENNNYVYASLGQQVGKFYFSLATGLKMFWIKNDMKKRNFIRNLSSARISYGISDKWNLMAAFGYSPGIPSLSSLTDYPQRVSPYLVSNGNPNLKVSENFNYQLAPSFRYKKFSASMMFVYRTVKNFVMNDMVYLGDHVFLDHSINARKSWNLGSSINLKLDGIAGFGINLSFGVEHSETKGDDWMHQLNSFAGNVSLWWNKGPYTITYWRKLPGKYLSGHMVRKEENGDALSFSYKPNSHWRVGVDWMYMFDVKGTRYPSWNYSDVNPSRRERYIKHNGNMVVLSLSYSTDFGSIFRSVSRSLNNSDYGSSLLKM